MHLLGRKFVVVRDHRSLECVQKMKENNSGLTRWCLKLQSSQFKMQYRPGETNSNVNGLSTSIGLTLVLLVWHEYVATYSAQLE